MLTNDVSKNAPPATRPPRSTNHTRFLGANGHEYFFVGELGYGYGRHVCQNLAGEVYFMKVLSGRSYKREFDVLKTVSSERCFHFPKFIDAGCLSTDPKRKFVVMELLGDNLAHALTRVTRENGHGFQDQTCLGLAIQTLNAIEELHYCGFVSRDIKPENFVHGRCYPNTGHIYMLDFSISRGYRDENNLHVLNPLSKFSGTQEYCSIAQHDRQPPSRVDDLEAWIYTLISLFDGKLEWHELSRDRVNRERVKARKIALRLAPQLCRRFPKMMKKLMEEVDSTNRTAQPNYQKLYAIIEAEMRAHGFTLDVVYDWELNYNRKFLCFGKQE